MQYANYTEPEKMPKQHRWYPNEKGVRIVLNGVEYVGEIGTAGRAGYREVVVDFEPDSRGEFITYTEIISVKDIKNAIETGTPIVRRGY